MSDPLRKLTLAALASLLCSCGQTGRLYLPEPAGEVVTRPTQTPAQDSAPATASPGGAAPEEDPKKDQTKDKKN